MFKLLTYGWLRYELRMIMYRYTPQSIRWLSLSPMWLLNSANDFDNHFIQEIKQSSLNSYCFFYKNSNIWFKWSSHLAMSTTMSRATHLADLNLSNALEVTLLRLISRTHLTIPWAMDLLLNSPSRFSLSAAINSNFTIEKPTAMNLMLHMMTIYSFSFHYYRNLQYS